jgi:tetratricopeptide (TPR) repeat protein
MAPSIFACRSVVCGQPRLRSPGLSRLRSIAAMSMLLSAFGVAARAEEWQDCTSNIQDRVLAGCSAVIKQGTRPDVDLSRARVIRGEWYNFRGRADEALADFEAAERLDPQSYLAFLGRGAALTQEGRLDEAQAIFESAIKRDPQNAYV